MHSLFWKLAKWLGGNHERWNQNGISLSTRVPGKTKPMWERPVIKPIASSVTWAGHLALSIEASSALTCGNSWPSRTLCPTNSKTFHQPVKLLSHISSYQQNPSIYRAPVNINTFQRIFCLELTNTSRKIKSMYTETSRKEVLYMLVLGVCREARRPTKKTRKSEKYWSINIKAF